MQKHLQPKSSDSCDRSKQDVVAVEVTSAAALSNLWRERSSVLADTVRIRLAVVERSPGHVVKQILKKKRMSKIGTVKARNRHYSPTINPTTSFIDRYALELTIKSNASKWQKIKSYNRTSFQSGIGKNGFRAICEDYFSAYLSFTLNRYNSSSRGAGKA